MTKAELNAMPQQATMAIRIIAMMRNGFVAKTRYSKTSIDNFAVASTQGWLSVQA